MFCAIIVDETWAYEIAKNLLEKGAKLGLKDPNGLNALMYACIHSTTTTPGPNLFNSLEHLNKNLKKFYF